MHIILIITLYVCIFYRGIIMLKHFWVMISLDTLLKVPPSSYNNQYKTNIIFCMFYDLENAKPDSQVSVASSTLRTFILNFFQIKVGLYQIMPEFFMTIWINVRVFPVSYILNAKVNLVRACITNAVSITISKGDIMNPCCNSKVIWRKYFKIFFLFGYLEIPVHKEIDKTL